MSSPLTVLKNGIINENPTFVQVIGMCPTLAVTTSIINGLGMGIATMLVLTGSNIVISLLRKFIDPKVRIPAFVIVIAGFVTIVELLMKAYVPPELNNALGIFIPLIVVNCIILARAEAFASKSSVIDSAFDGIGMGIGFTLALAAMGAIREILGNGSLFDHQVLPEVFPQTLIMIMAPGAFFTLACLMALLKYFQTRKEGEH